MEKRIGKVLVKRFCHHKYKWLNKYYVSEDGIIFNKHDTPVNYHKNVDRNGGFFVRLSGQHKSVSLTVGYVVLYTWNGKPKTKDLIAIHKNGNPKIDHITNLKWGSREDQSEIAMKNPIHFKRISKMGKHNIISNQVQKKIKRLAKKHTISQTARMCQVSYITANKYSN